MRKFILLFSVLLFNLVEVNNGNYYQQKADVFDCVKDKIVDIEESISQRYKDSCNFYIDYKCVACHNLRQEDLNFVYNRKHNVTYKGTCSIVAATMCEKFYMENSDKPIYVSTNTLFDESMIYARAKEFYNGDGTIAGKSGEIASFIFKEYNINNSIWTNKDNIFQGIKDFTVSDNCGKKGKVQIFGVKGHDMIANGWLEISFDYQEEHQFLWNHWETTEHKTMQYVIVCTGWENSYTDEVTNLVQVEKAYDFFEMGTIENYVIGIDFPERNC